MDVQGGAQPLWNEDRSVAVLGNGEIYNAGALSERLLRSGHRLDNHSDMVVVPHLYEQLGAGAFEALDGMFALVVIDLRRRLVLLARDRMGEKPLSLFKTQTGLWFASEQRALLQAGVVKPRLRAGSLPEYLMNGFSSEPLSMVEGIEKLPAGHLLMYDLTSGESRSRAYWSASKHLGDRRPSTDELVEAISTSVADSCHSDVPVGIALSGGLDSSIVATLAARSVPDLRCFTVGYEGAAASDETGLASEFATLLGLPITITRLAVSDVGREYAKLCSLRDEPIGDLAGPAYDAVAAAAREAGVPVLLTGQGGDELFFGYPWIHELARREMEQAEATAEGRSVPHRWQPIPARLRDIPDWVTSRGGRQILGDLDEWHALHDTAEARALPLFQFQRGYRQIRRLTLEVLGADIFDIPPDRFLTVGRGTHTAADYCLAVCDTYLRTNGLAQVDRLTMRHSVESRTPLVSRDLVEMVLAGLVGAIDLRNGPKEQLRLVAKQLLPPAVLARPKRGFTPPMREWLRSIWQQNSKELREPALVDIGLISPDGFRTGIRHPVFRSGRVNQVALRLATLEFWARGVL
jgi:asparagine synthase (glutamine-hydrolysing)